MAKSGLSYAQRLTLSPREAAALLGVSERLIRMQIAEGQLPASRMGTRWLIPRAAIEAFGRGVQPAVAAQPLRAVR